MNIREVEALLREIATEAQINEWPIATRLRLQTAIKWCRSQQKAAATRRAVFRHKYDEQAEMLR